MPGLRRTPAICADMGDILDARPHTESQGFGLHLNLSRYRFVNSHMNDRHGEKCIETGREMFPTHDHATVLPLDPGTHPLG
jgi:hypothetical protein